MKDLNEYDRLIEELTLEKVYLPSEAPNWGGYGGWHARNKHYHFHLRHLGKNDVVYLNDKGQLHRLHGPAYVSKKYKMVRWYKNDVLHRDGGPALQHKDTFCWYFEGKLHNLNGPAVVDPAGPYQYWIHGVRFTKKQYEWEIQRRKIKGEK